MPEVEKKKKEWSWSSSLLLCKQNEAVLRMGSPCSRIVVWCWGHIHHLFFAQLTSCGGRSLLSGWYSQPSCRRVCLRCYTCVKFFEFCTLFKNWKTKLYPPPSHRDSKGEGWRSEGGEVLRHWGIKKEVESQCIPYYAPQGGSQLHSNSPHPSFPDFCQLGFLEQFDFSLTKLSGWQQHGNEW